MTVVFKSKSTMDTFQYSNVNNIAYNTVTKVYTINYTGGSVSYDGNNYYIFVLMA